MLSQQNDSIPSAAAALVGKLKCLKVCISHSWGGLEQVAASDAIELAELGLSIGVLCLKDSPFHEQISKQKGVTAFPLEFEPRNYFDLKLRNEIRHHLEGGTNLIHTHQTSLLGSIVPWLWSERQVGLIATRHIMNNHDKRDFFHRAIYGRLDKMVVMSQALRDNILKTHPIREKTVKVIHLGLDFEKFDPSRVQSDRQRALWQADSDTVVIGLVGRIDPAKGQSTFIKAAAGLIKNEEDRRKLKFVMVGEETLGSHSSHLEELKQMVKQFRLEASVVFSGYQNNIPEIMSSFDIVVMPSRQEAFGLVAIEAMAMECPVIISSGGSAQEIVGNEQYGLKVRPDDAFDLQRQLRSLLERPEERKKMGQRGRIYVKENFDRKGRLIKTLRLYERVLRRRRAL